jgi:hypothetical protein
MNCSTEYIEVHKPCVAGVSSVSASVSLHPRLATNRCVDLEMTRVDFVAKSSVSSVSAPYRGSRLRRRSSYLKNNPESASRPSAFGTHRGTATAYGLVKE